MLAPSGHFAVLWLRAELSDPLQRKIDGLASSLMLGTRYPGARPGEPLRWEEWFEPLAVERTPFVWDFGEAALTDYVSSFSVVATLSASEQSKLLAEVSGWTPPGARMRLPFYAEIHLGRARPRPWA